jgi:hypothetical protein
MYRLVAWSSSFRFVAMSPSGTNSGVRSFDNRSSFVSLATIAGFLPAL